MYMGFNLMESKIKMSHHCRWKGHLEEYALAVVYNSVSGFSSAKLCFHLVWLFYAGNEGHVVFLFVSFCGMYLLYLGMQASYREAYPRSVWLIALCYLSRKWVELKLGSNLPGDCCRWHVNTVTTAWLAQVQDSVRVGGITLGENADHLLTLWFAH